jgi:hypothetical protein
VGPQYFNAWKRPKRNEARTVANISVDHHVRRLNGWPQLPVQAFGTHSPEPPIALSGLFQPRTSVLVFSSFQLQLCQPERGPQALSGARVGYYRARRVVQLIVLRQRTGKQRRKSFDTPTKGSHCWRCGLNREYLKTETFISPSLAFKNLLPIHIHNSPQNRWTVFHLRRGANIGGCTLASGRVDEEALVPVMKVSLPFLFLLLFLMIASRHRLV